MSLELRGAETIGSVASLFNCLWLLKNKLLLCEGTRRAGAAVVLLGMGLEFLRFLNPENMIFHYTSKKSRGSQ